MKARARCELKQLCGNCYINPDFSVKMSDVSEHSEFCYPEKKREKRGGHMRKCLLTELGRAGRTETSGQIFSRPALPLSQ